MGGTFAGRLVVGGATLLVLSIAACLYSILQLSTLSGTAREVLDHDHRMIQSQEQLSEAFLSEFRYGGKYILSRKEDRYEQLRQFKSDFTRHLGELQSRPHSDRVGLVLAKVEQIHRQYHKLFDQEVAYIRANQSYAQSRYAQEREKLLETGLNELERLKLELRRGLHQKLESMERSARIARSITISALLVVLALGSFIAVKVRSGVGLVVKRGEVGTEANSLKVPVG